MKKTPLFRRVKMSYGEASEVTMERFFLFVSVLAFSALTWAQTDTFDSAQDSSSQEWALPWQLPEDEILNCVNPGGSCNGSVPCCDSYNNACVRNRCQRVTGDEPFFSEQ